MPQDLITTDSSGSPASHHELTQCLSCTPEIRGRNISGKSVAHDAHHIVMVKRQDRVDCP
eukprot:11020838-Alexandrium_andersonii.AAC.1